MRDERALTRESGKCGECGAYVNVNEWELCAHCERMKQAIYALLRRNGVAK